MSNILIIAKQHRDRDDNSTERRVDEGATSRYTPEYKYMRPAHLANKFGEMKFLDGSTDSYAYTEGINEFEESSEEEYSPFTQQEAMRLPSVTSSVKMPLQAYASVTQEANSASVKPGVFNVVPVSDERHLRMPSVETEYFETVETEVQVPRESEGDTEIIVEQVETQELSESPLIDQAPNSRPININVNTQPNKALINLDNFNKLAERRK